MRLLQSYLETSESLFELQTTRLHINFMRKMKVNRTIDKYKARFVIKGYRQQEGLDYFDTYSFITRINFIRMVFAITVLRNLKVRQMDVKIVFLNGDLDKEIYIEKSESFFTPRKKKVCKLVASK